MPRAPRRAAGVVILLLTACSRGTTDPPAAEPASAATLARPSAATAPARSALPPPPAGPFRARASPCLPGEPYAAPGLLAEAAEDELQRGTPARALACAEEAIRLSPRHVPALAGRAAALAALGRLDEGRTAYARALAVDPDDPATLLGAAELYVRRLGPSRDALETGLEYALRGGRAAKLRGDPAAAARLALVAGMAENDLGRSHLALPHLDRALAARPADPDAVYERGVALFELCRFDEAQRAFERALALAPDDPWALHQLGLLAERRGEERRAGELTARARELAPEEFRPDLPVDGLAFRAEVEAAIAALPEPDRRALRQVPVEIADLPDAADLLEASPPLSPSILGLFRGPAEHEPCAAGDGTPCRSIVVYRKNLVRFARDRRELTQQVRLTLLHELGHLRGETEDELRDRGLE
jgi:Flp pilus assembly protein TadD